MSWPASANKFRQGQRALRGIMLESHLQEGNQQLGAGVSLAYGQSITDACLSLEQTAPLLAELAAAVRGAAA